MRSLNSVFDWNGSIVGSMAINGMTACGAPIDTIGFKEVMMLIVANAPIVGTNGNVATMQFNIQESALLTGTGTAWANINNGQVSGTCVCTIPFLSGSNFSPNNNLVYERLQDGTRLRYLRILATMTGTSSFNVRFTGGLLLGTPYDSALVTNAVVQNTGTTEYTIL